MRWVGFRRVCNQRRCRRTPEGAGAAGAGCGELERPPNTAELEPRERVTPLPDGAGICRGAEEGIGRGDPIWRDGDEGIG